MSDAASGEPPYPKRGYAWYVCLILLLAYILSFLDRTIVSLLVIPMEHDLHISDTEIGLLQGFSFALFYAVLGLPIARLVDARSRRGIIAAGIFMWSVMTAACGAAGRFSELFAARVGVGAGEATLLPGAVSMLADYFPPKRRGLALGVFSTGIFLGSGLALIVGGLLIRAIGNHTYVVPLLGPLDAWRVVFLAVGLPGLIVAALMAAVAEPPRLGRKAAAGYGFDLAEVIAYFRRNAATILCHNMGFTLVALVGFAAGAWIPAMFIRRFGWTAAEIGIRFGLITLVVGPLGSVVGGWLCDRMEHKGRRDGKLRVGLIAALGAFPFALAFPLVPKAGVALALIGPFYFFVSFVWGLAPAALQEIMPNQMRGQATAVYTGILNLVGLGLGPTSVALITDFVFRNPQAVNFSIAAIVPAAALLAALLFRIGYAPYLRTLDRLPHWMPRERAAVAPALADI